MIWHMKNGIFNRQSLLELSLLAIFGAGLFISHFIVDNNNRVLTSPGIHLAGSGLTVHLPEQHGWRGVKEWQFEKDNTFVLPAVLMGRSEAIVEVSWNYILTSTAKSSRQALEQLVSKKEGDLQNVQQTAGSCPMEYVRLFTSDYGRQQYTAAVLLDFGRVLTLQVVSKMDPVLAQDVFLTLTDGLEYQKPDEITRGVELLKNVRTLGMDLFAADPSRYYLIRDPSGNVLGHETIEVRFSAEQPLQINKTTSLPTGAVVQREHQFKSSKPFETFVWECQIADPVKSPDTLRLTFKEDGVLLAENAAGHTQTLYPGPAMAGEILLDWLVRYFLETQQQQSMVDILYFDGTLIPSQLSSIPPAEALGKTQEMAFAVRVEMLNGWLTEFYFDANKKPLGKITRESARRILLWDPVESKEIEKYIKKPPVRKGPVARREAKKENMILCLARETL
jgi:hypothetical protein